MRKAIKVFEILRIIVGILMFLLCLLLVIGIANKDETIVNAIITNSGKDGINEETIQALLNTYFVFYIVVLIWEVVAIVVSVLTLRKVKNPVDKKPVMLGIFNILCRSLISGILCLCLNADNN